MTNSNDAKSGCFSGLLRRLLCTGNLPTHPSGSLTESSSAEFEKPKTEAKLGVPAPEPGPGVVARLMGLNSLPDANWVPKTRTPDAVSRSKSVNFADYLLEFNSSQAHHRRVRTSASFREVPRLLYPQNDFLVVYMKDFNDENKEIGSNVRKSEISLREVKQGKEQSNNGQKNRSQIKESTKKKENQRNKIKISKLKDEPRREVGKNCSKSRKCVGNKEMVSVLPSYKQIVPKNGGAANSKSAEKKTTIQKQASGGPKLNKKTKKKNVRQVAEKKEPECDPENSSPISVLDFPDALRPLGMEDSKQPLNTDDQLEQNAMKKRDYNSKDMGGSDCYSDVVGRICTLAEEDIIEADWMVKNVYEFEEYEELCMELERHVVSVLLVQTLDDLV